MVKSVSHSIMATIVALGFSDGYGAQNPLHHYPLHELAKSEEPAVLRGLFFSEEDLRTLERELKMEERPQSPWVKESLEKYEGYKKKTHELIKGGYSVNAVDDAGCTPLGLAAQALNEPVIRALLSYPEINVDTLDPNNMTALEVVASRGDRDLVRLLIAVDAALEPIDTEQKTALTHALDPNPNSPSAFENERDKEYGAAKALMAAGAPVNEKEVIALRKACYWLATESNQEHSNVLGFALAAQNLNNAKPEVFEVFKKYFSEPCVLPEGSSPKEGSSWGEVFLDFVKTAVADESFFMKAVREEKAVLAALAQEIRAKQVENASGQQVG